MKQMKEKTQPFMPYNPFRIPPTLQLSLLHRQCSQFGPSTFEGKQCPCCKQYKRSLLKIGCNIDEIYAVNEPVGIYFTYIKIMCVVLLVIMLFTGIYSLVEIYNQCSTDETQSQCVYVYGIPVAKIHAFFKIPLIAMNGVVIVLLYVIVGFLFFKISYLHQKNICHHEVPSDYSVLLSNMDHSKISFEDIKQGLKNFKIKEVLYTHKIKKYMSRLAQRSVCEAKKEIFEWKRDLGKAEEEKLKIRSIQDSLLHVKNKLILGQDVTLRTDKIIVTFQTPEDKQTFDLLFKVGLWKTIYRTFCGGNSLIIADHPIFVEPLGEPNQILWQNLEVTSKNRYIRVFISNLISLIILFIGFAAVLELTKIEKNNDEQGDIWMSFLFAFLIEATNFALNYSIQILTNWEGRYTMTGQVSIKLYKKCFGFFLNTTLIPFSLFLFSLFSQDEDDLIRNIFTVFLVSNLLSPIIGVYLNPKFLYKRYRQRKIRVQDSLCLITQTKSNQTFEKIDFMLDERYALICQLFMNCLFYSAVFPFGVLITLAGMIITYWSSKIWLVNLCSVPKFSFKIAKRINIISCYFPCIYAFGYAANLYMSNNQNVQFDRSYSLYIAIVTIPLTLLFILFGEKVAKKWIKTHRKSVTQCLNKEKHYLTYKGLNPTSFFHSDLNSRIQVEEKNMWQNLLSYVFAKESKVLQVSQNSSEIRN